MNKKKVVEKHKKSRQPKPEITAAEHRANANLAVNLLMPIIEKMMTNPADIQPVAESFDDLLFEMRNGVKRQPYIMQAGRRRLAVCDDVVTEFEYQPSGDAEAITKDDTFTDAATTTLTITKDDTFTEAEKLILEQIQNA